MVSVSGSVSSSVSSSVSGSVSGLLASTNTFITSWPSHLCLLPAEAPPTRAGAPGDPFPSRLPGRAGPAPAVAKQIQRAEFECDLQEPRLSAVTLWWTDAALKAA